MTARQFTAADQLTFAGLSGDYNPLHIDPLEARRSMFGTTVVHGMHLVLWSLDEVVTTLASPVELQSIKARFLKPVPVGEAVSLTTRESPKGHYALKASRNGHTVATVQLVLVKASPANHQAPPDRKPERVDLRNPGPDDLPSLSGSIDLCLEEKTAVELFPHLARALPAMTIAILLGTSRLVGMECPGHHSLYAELNLATGGGSPEHVLNYSVTHFDPRFSLAEVTLDGPGMTGRLQAFRRPEPFRQSPYNLLKKQILPGEFAGQRAWIIGGSRGLGEVTAKLLAAGGASVLLTFREGETEARHVVEEIKADGGEADCFRMDVLDEETDLQDWPVNKWRPSHVYYFATPFVFSGITGQFSPGLFNRFCDYYVSGFMKVIDAACALKVRGCLNPSTVAIEETPGDMAEYVAAKMASEALGNSVRKRYPGLALFQPRFPRMATDQTVSLSPVDNQDPAPFLLNSLRTFRDDSSKT